MVSVIVTETFVPPQDNQKTKYTTSAAAHRTISSNLDKQCVGARNCTYSTNSKTELNICASTGSRSSNGDKRSGDSNPTMI